MGDQKSNSEDSTGTSAFVQTDEDVGLLRMQNEKVGLVGISDDHTHDRAELSHEDSTNVLSCSRDIREMRNNGNGVTDAVQSTYPEKVNDNLPSLGVGDSSDTILESKGPHRTMRAAIPKLSMICGQISDGNPSNPGFNAGFSGFAKKADGISSLVHNVGISSSFAQNMDAHSSTVQNESEFFYPAQNMHDWTLNKNVDFVPGFGGNMGATFQIVDSNTGFPGLQFQVYQNNPVQTVEDGFFPERKRLRLPAAGQQLPAYQDSPVQTVGKRLFPERIGLQLPDLNIPDTKGSAAQGQVMPVARGGGLAQASDVPTGSSHMRYPTQFPPITHPIQRMTRFIKPSTHKSNSGPSQAASSLTPVPLMPVPPQAKTATSLSPLPGTVAFIQPAFQSTTLPSQVQTAHPPSPLAKEIPLLHVSKDLNFPDNKGSAAQVVQGQVLRVARESGPAQGFNVPVGLSQMIYATRFPPIACPTQCSTRLVTHQSISESAQAAPSVNQATQIYPVQPQVQAAASLTHLSRTAAFLQPASQSTVPTLAETVHPPPPIGKEKPPPRASKGKSKINVPTRPPGQGISDARASGLVQTSNAASVGPGQKRCAIRAPSIASPGQRRATIHSSVLASAQTGSPLTRRSQTAPVPPQAPTAASFPSFPRTADFLRTLSQSRYPLPHPLQTAHPYSQMAREIRLRLPQDSNRFPQPIGYKCDLCNRDLSFASEGQILQPGVRPSTAVLPCGHHFHDYCLQQITPADQTDNPPCIHCDMHET
ncbi:uncharacterized protein LOC102624479 isoform X2 [Citrus sinensis]|uniref:uncharacterized protein LOC102624479 isoform X2 n=2 Tax=Citrus sinensis TaxID=2711 RepID=UPI002278214C|nr:uncharacterized protein LOC102624479 isoform X2 [Citrus sinensis]